MDPLTHTATGLFLSRAGLNRWTPRATAILILAANAPDLDIVTASGGPSAYLHYHRHLTHALVSMPVVALFSVAAVRLVGRKPVAWKGAFAAALVGVASHLALDFTNIYGIRMLLPFSAQWLRADLTSVMDIWIWAALLVAVAAPWLGKLVGSEIASGTKAPSHYGRGFAWCALAFLALYNGGRAVLHNRATAMLESRLYRDAPPVRVAALPSASNPLAWRGLVETSEFYAVEDFNVAGELDTTHAAIFRKAEPGPALEAARQSEPFQRLLEFSQYPLWRVSPAPEPENAQLVELFDLRFGTPAAPGFAARAVVDGRGRVVRSSFTFGEARPR